MELYKEVSRVREPILSFPIFPYSTGSWELLVLEVPETGVRKVANNAVMCSC